jgi:hypothetical protein
MCKMLSFSTQGTQENHKALFRTAGVLVDI